MIIMRPQPTDCAACRTKSSLAPELGHAYDGRSSSTPPSPHHPRRSMQHRRCRLAPCLCKVPGVTLCHAHASHWRLGHWRGNLGCAPRPPPSVELLGASQTSWHAAFVAAAASLLDGIHARNDTRHPTCSRSECAGTCTASSAAAPFAAQLLPPPNHHKVGVVLLGWVQHRCRATRRVVAACAAW